MIHQMMLICAHQNRQRFFFRLAAWLALYDRLCTTTLSLVDYSGPKVVSENAELDMRG